MLTMEETAKLLNVHYNTIRNWVSQGKIGYFKEGGIIRIPKEEIEKRITKEKGGKI